jgi:S-formylglutathione hydrolase FrmB
MVVGGMLRRVTLSRRGFLIGGAAVLAGGTAGAYGLVENGVLPGRSALDRVTGRCDVPDAWPRVPVGPAKRGTFRSAARGRDVGYVVAWPPGSAPGDPLPVVLVLHGRGSAPGACLDELHLDAYLAAHVAGGGAPFVLACAQGDDRYWPPRADGDDPLRMLTDEFLPMLRDLGATTAPMGVFGWSMGGYGALLWARLAADGALPRGVRLTAAVAESPALFRSYGAATRGSFDSAADFARWGDLLARPGVGSGVVVRVDCGTSDPFAEVTRAYRARVTADGGFANGCHDDAYWRSRAAAQLEFLGRRLKES